jgi:hypothetical protein
MRTVGLWLLLVGCGDDSSRHIVDGPTGCQTTDCAAASGSISGLQWLMPCEMSASEKTCLSTFVSTQATVMGAVGATYQVTIRLRGVVELKSYAGGGGTTTNYWTTGGIAPNDGYNVYELAISEPPQNYFLNSGPSNVQIAYPLDYSETIQVTTGATLTLSADPVDAGEVKNVDANLQPVSIAGTTVAQPYDGQFIEMDVTDIEGS